MRDLSVEKQDLDYSCGAASVATILRFFYNKEVYEKNILEYVIKLSEDKDSTTSFFDLQKAVAKFGFKAVGIFISFEKLKTI